MRETLATTVTPNNVALVKIAPGHAAAYWPQCLKEGYICVGWDAVGDLARFDSEAQFRAAFEKRYKYHGNLSATRRKTNELWTLTKLRSGDKVIANKGVAWVLGIGVVQEPGYEWRPDKSRGEYYHTVRVKWDTSFARRIATHNFAYISIRRRTGPLRILSQKPSAYYEEARLPRARSATANRGAVSVPLAILIAVRCVTLKLADDGECWIALIAEPQCLATKLATNC
jgi:hypothetical protein